MLHGTMTKPVDITYVKKHESCFEPMKDCLLIDYIIIVSKNKFSMQHLPSESDVAWKIYF